MVDKANINKIPSNEPSKNYVTEGSTLNCTFGDSTVKLQTPGRKSVKINGKLQANITDCKPLANIPSFGKCSCRANPTVAAATAANHGVLIPMPCVPNTTIPWINGKEDVMVDGAPALLETSKNMCLWGGTISIGDKPKKGLDWGRVGEGTTKIANGGLLCWIGLGALAAAGVALAVLTAPVSVPTLVAAAAIGTVAAGGAGAAICLTTGVSDIAEGEQDVAYGMAGSDQESRNPLKEAIGSEAYYNAEMIGTGLSLAAMAEVPYLSPFAVSAGVTGAGAETAMNRKLASNQKSPAPPAKQNPVKTSALQLEGKVDAVKETKLAENAGTRPKPVSSGPRFKTNLDNHIKYTDPNVPRRRGIGGAHNKEEFLKNDVNILEVQKHPTIKGVEKVKYQVPSVDAKTGEITGWKSTEFEKTVYDPKIISDEHYIQFGKEAAHDAASKGALGREWTGCDSQGVKWRGYTTDGEVASFFPEF